MKVAFDAQQLLNNEKTGIQWMAHNLILSMIKQSDHTFTLNIAAKGVPQVEIDRMDEYRATNASINVCAWMSPKTAKVYRACSSFLPIPYQTIFGAADLSHFFNYNVPYGTSGILVTTICDMVYRTYPETMNSISRKFLNLSTNSSARRADRIVTISEFSHKEILRYLRVPEEKLLVVPCAVNESLYHINYSEDDVARTCQNYGIHLPYFLYLGTLEPRKNLERLIDGYAFACKARTELPMLVIAGRKGWLYDTIFERVQALGIAEKIKFPGYISPIDAPKLMKGAELFLFPSIYEGFGMPPLEAAACGTPVILSDAASLPEVMGDAAMYVDPFRAESICDAILALMGNTNLKHDLSQKGLARARVFSWDASAKKVLTAYEEMFRNNKHGK